MKKRLIILLILISILSIWGQAYAQAKAKPKLPLPVRLEDRAVKSLRRGKIMLNFESADIRVVAKLMSELTKKNIIMDERVKGNISILSSQEVTPTEAWRMFVSALNAYGYDVVDWGKTAKILPIKSAKKEKAKFYSESNASMADEYLVAVVALKSAEPTKVANVLRQLVTEHGTIMPYSKSLLIADDSFNVKRLIKIARHLDTERDRTITRTFYLKWSNSTEVAKSLLEIYKPKDSHVIVSDFPSNNAIIVVATNQQLKDIEQLLVEMDRYVDNRDRTRKFRVVQLENANAEEVAKILSEMLKESGRVEQKNHNNNRPHYHQPCTRGLQD